MECLKCGRETSGTDVFCADCLKNMEKSPVKLNAPVVIPKREAVRRRTPQKKLPKPEEIIEGLHKKIKALTIALWVMILLFTLSACALGYFVWNDQNEVDLGSNYSTVTYPSEGGLR